jgi:hypothetical protein
MRALTASEKRTIRFGGLCLLGYLALFGAFRVGKYFTARRTEYQQLVREATALQQKVEVYQARAGAAKKLMEDFNLDPAKLSKATVVAQASSAIQNAARAGGLQLGPVRESPARPSSDELASMQIEGFGPVPAIMGMLSRLESLGFPLIIDSVTFSPMPQQQQGQIKVNLTITILDFEQWIPKEAPHA